MTDTPQGPVDPEDEHASRILRASRDPAGTHLHPRCARRGRAARVASTAGRGRIVVLRADAPGPRPSPCRATRRGSAGLRSEPGVAQGYPQPVVNPYGGYAQPPAPGGQPASAQPGYGAPAGYGQQNPYGGYTQAPAYAGERATHPGSIGYVEANFGPVATFGQRAIALILDTALLLVGMVPVMIGFILLAASAPTQVYYDELGNLTRTGGDGGLAAAGGVLIALGFLVTIALWLWNRVFRMGRTGQSLGKQALGLKLVDDKSGQPIGAGTCFLREARLRSRQPGLLPVVPVDAVGHRQGDAGRQGRALHGVRPAEAVAAAERWPAGIRPVRATSTRGCCAPR